MVTKSNLYILKNEIAKADFPPSFESDLLFYNSNLKKFNCYAYVMQFKIPSFFSDDNFYMPGFLSDSVPNTLPYNQKTLINCFILDCKWLGLSCEESSIESNLKNINSYKVGIYLSGGSFRKIHFSRQNKDLRWSEKIGWSEYDEINILEDPRYSEDYELIKVMEISKR